MMNHMIPMSVGFLGVLVLISGSLGLVDGDTARPVGVLILIIAGMLWGARSMMKGKEPEN